MSEQCDICRIQHSKNTKSCDACNSIILKYKNKCTTSEVRTALIKAYSRTVNGKRFFKCDYTGIESHFNLTEKSLDPIEDAIILTLDHKNPILKSNRGEVVVSLYIVNQIKGKIPFDCFNDYITILAELLDNKNDINSKKFLKKLNQIKKFQMEKIKLETSING